MLETARQFLTQIDNLPISERLENAIKNSDRALFILHDQLNLAVFPPEVLARKPILIFVESQHYAIAIPHHKQKLTYILSAQRHFAIACHQQGFPVLNLFTTESHAASLANFLQQHSHIQLTYMQPSEWDTRSQMLEVAKPYAGRVTAIANQFFIADVTQFKSKIKKGYRLETFYRELRKQTGYLMDGKQPLGGKWNYDKENRKSLPKKVSIPAIPATAPDQITQEVIDLVNTYLPNNFGELQHFNYAVTRDRALHLAQDFIANRLANFGAYEDAIKTGEPFLFHSVLSIYLNNGLLLPQELCEMALAAYQQNLVSLNSVEGFVRQILGWREYIRIYYEAQMPDVRHANYFQFHFDLPRLYWDAQTDLHCLRDAVSNVITHG
jgi:deoxyribodipyrimidine photolyase-related protein